MNELPSKRLFNKSGFAQSHYSVTETSVYICKIYGNLYYIDIDILCISQAYIALQICMLILSIFCYIEFHYMKNKICTHLNMFCYRSFFCEYIYNQNNTFNVIRFTTESKFATKCIRDADAHLSNDVRGQSFLTFCCFHFA